MNRIRLATVDECEVIKAKADLDQSCNVFALDTGKGTGYAVRRVATEIDPLIAAPDWDLRLRVLFYRDLETACWAQGATSYYFNVHADDKEWLDTFEKWGAVRTSTAPEYRYKKSL